MTPAIRNDSHTAAPATSPAAPSSAKIPAPTIAPTPMNAACRTDRYFLPDGVRPWFSGDVNLIRHRTP